MDGKTFIKKLRKLLKTYLTEKYKDNKIPFYDAALSWSYSVNSFTHVRNTYAKVIFEDVDGNSYINIDDYIEITLNDKLNFKMLL